MLGLFFSAAVATLGARPDNRSYPFTGQMVNPAHLATDLIKQAAPRHTRMHIKKAPPLARKGLCTGRCEACRTSPGSIG